MKYALFTIGGLSLINVIFLSLVSNFNIGLILQGIVSVLIILYAFCFGKIPKPAHIAIGAVCLTALSLIAFLTVYGSLDNTS